MNRISKTQVGHVPQRPIGRDATASLGKEQLGVCHSWLSDLIWGKSEAVLLYS